MKKMNIKLSILFSIGLQLTTFSQNIEWAKSMGGSSTDLGLSIAVDALGNVYTIGNYQGTADMDPGAATNYLTSNGGADIFISKQNAAGNIIWAKSIGGVGDDSGTSITVDAAGNIYFTGYFLGTVDFDPSVGTHNLISNGASDVFISKLDANGDFVWAKSMGGTVTDQSKSITVDAAGNVYTIGVFQGTVDFDPGTGTYNLTQVIAGQGFISKLDATGNFVWAKRTAEVQSIILDLTGNIYLAGVFQGTVDFDPGAGVYNLTSTSYNMHVLKLDASGNFLWAKMMGDHGAAGNKALPKSITIGATGNVYISGKVEGTVDFDPGVGTYDLTSNGDTDVFICKLDANGNFVWAKKMGPTIGVGGCEYNSSESIALDANENVYITGYFKGTVDFDPGVGTNHLISNTTDIFICKLDAAGNFIWAKKMGGASGDWGKSIVLDALGNIYTTGYFIGTADLDPTSGSSYLTSNGSSDIFVAKYSQNILGLENNLDNAELTVYPNPASTVLNIDITSSATTSANIKIVNLLGATVATHKLSSGNNSIDVSNLTKGVYFIQAENPSTDLGFGSIKFVKD